MGLALSTCLTFLSRRLQYRPSPPPSSRSIASDCDEVRIMEERDIPYYADDEMDSSDDEEYIYYSGGGYGGYPHNYDDDMLAGMRFYRGRSRANNRAAEDSSLEGVTGIF
ncbi:uncharacterized protein BP5553_04823 [Venustampulla echinocandica]|uniref:Uncharacterized protein n=1 Tax=Venustampulla echinocandica TaxID=2656787 RepID=A0A370TPD5_9HELO|nr:uncharacterized protein BP5553_04823 [Venustampulla echinocandica]RDL37390.1 hypothetical protein BP5553_04823 [Venustampulla echinocandica]